MSSSASDYITVKRAIDVVTLGIVFAVILLVSGSMATELWTAAPRCTVIECSIRGEVARLLGALWAGVTITTGRVAVALAVMGVLVGAQFYWFDVR